MRKLMFTFFLAVLLAPSVGYASIYGILKGKVVDDEGKPVIGATVLVDGTKKGAKVSGNGEYVINNITAGAYTVIVRAVGMNEQKADIRISADQVYTHNVTLSSSSVKIGEVVKVADRIMVDKSAVGSQNNITADQIAASGRDLNGVIGLSAGVQSTGSGTFNVRGARSSETQMRIDGVDITNPFTGSAGMAGAYNPAMPSSLATEEVQVKTGGFGAEYGESQGGVINTVAKQGRDKYEGQFKWRTDVNSLNGSQKSGLKVVRENSKWVIKNQGEGVKYEGGDENTFEAGFGGPIPGIEDAVFYISGIYLKEQYQGNSYGVKDPWGNNLGQMPHNQIWRKNITGRFTFPIIEGVKLIVGGTYGLVSYESSSWSWLYQNDCDSLPNGSGQLVSKGISESIAKQNVINHYAASGFAKINHTLTNTSYYEFSLSYNINNEESARRKGYEDPGFFTGFDVYYPQDKYTSTAFGTLEEAPIKNGIVVSDKIIDVYQPLYGNRKTTDGYSARDFILRNPLTGYYEGEPNTTGTNNAYGLQGAFYTGGGSGFEFRYGNWWQIDGSYSNYLKLGDFTHKLQAGFEVKLFEQHHHENNNPYDGNPFYDLYTDKWGGNLYTADAEVYDKTSSPFTPKKIAWYVQDQITFRGIVFSPSVRFDVFDPNSRYRLASENFTSIKADSGFSDASVKFNISPRLSINYPVTETSKIQISYNVYYKTAQLVNLYDGFAIDVLRSGTIVGNPNMDAQRTNEYQIDYENNFTDDFAFYISAYYRDTYNQLGVKEYPAVPTPFYMYNTSEYGNSKGVEFRLVKSLSDNFMFDLNYTLAQAQATSASPASNYSVATDIYSGKPTFPLATYTQPWDIRHSINASINLIWGNDQGPSIGDVYPLENVNWNITGVYQSGSPYTKYNLSQQAISELYSERGPDYWNVDTRISKSFNLKDWFDGAGNAKIELYAEIKNLFNLRDAISFYSTTGDPDDNGISLIKEMGSFGSTPWYKEATYADATTFAPDQYDSYGDRLYSAMADTDGNGVVTQQEKYESYIKYVETNLKFRGNYQVPIRVYAGFVFRF